MTNLKLIGAVLATTVLVVGCSPVSVPGASNAAPTPVISIPAAEAQRGSIQQAISYTGDVRARDQITVLPKATGRVEQVLVDIGSSVHAGDVIARLESNSPQIQ